MKKASVVVVLSVLVLVLSLHFVLSANSCQPTCGTNHRGGECYAYGPSITCEGGSLSCDDVECESKSMTCKQGNVRRRLHDKYYGSVISDAESGKTQTKINLISCYESVMCDIYCHSGKGDKQYCQAATTTYGHEIAVPSPPVQEVVIDGEPCEKTNSSE